MLLRPERACPARCIQGSVWAMALVEDQVAKAQPLNLTRANALCEDQIAQAQAKALAPGIPSIPKRAVFALPGFAQAASLWKSSLVLSQGT